LLTRFTFNKNYDTVRRSVANGHHTLDSQFLAASSHLPQDRAPTPNYDSVVHQDSQDSTSTTAGQHLPTIIEPQPEQHSVPPAPLPVVNSAVVDEPAPEQPVDETTEPEPAYLYAPPPPAPPEPVIITRENPINEELYAKYNKALLDLDNMQALVISLQEQLEQSQGVESAAADAPPPVQELRRRTRRLSDADSAAPSEMVTMVDEAPIQQEGVPLNIVVIIALGVFVTTYLFF
jgi:vesicle-associated membrane protein-associated protein A